MRNEKQNYDQRLTDLTVVETGLAEDVKTYIIMSPLVYGLGSGLFNRISIQIPGMIRAALKTKQAQIIGNGEGEWGHVHITDLTDLYEIITVKVLSGEELPSREKGFCFSENGRYHWKDVAQGLADALLALGVTKAAEVKSISLDEAANQWAPWAAGDKVLAEVAFASKYVTVHA